jgi:hypothetical protein
MAYVGYGYYVVVVLHIGGSKASDIKLVLQREPRTGKTWLFACSILPNEEHVNVVVLELLIEETSFTLSLDDFTLLSDAPVRVALHEGQHRNVCVYSAFVPIPYVSTNLRDHVEL